MLNKGFTSRGIAGPNTKRNNSWNGICLQGRRDYRGSPLIAMGSAERKVFADYLSQVIEKWVHIIGEALLYLLHSGRLLA